MEVLDSFDADVLTIYNQIWRIQPKERKMLKIVFYQTKINKR